MSLDITHAPALQSWVASANDAATDFPIQNPPFGRFRHACTDEPWRIGVAIGDQALDLRVAAKRAAWPADVTRSLEPLAGGDLNRFMALGASARRSLCVARSRKAPCRRPR